jgi:hypothetical protein
MKLEMIRRCWKRSAPLSPYCTYHLARAVEYRCPPIFETMKLTGSRGNVVQVLQSFVADAPRAKLNRLGGRSMLPHPFFVRYR